MKKKAFAWLLTFLMVLGMFPAMSFADEDAPLISATAHSFTDMPDNWSTAALEKAVDNGLLKGRAVGDKNLIEADAPLKRAEMAAVVNRAFGAVKQADLQGVADVAATAWYADDMARAIMMGTFVRDKEMHPESNISRQEAFVVLARAFKISSAGVENKALDGFSDRADVASWAENELNAMVEAGYVKGSNGTLNPKANMSRAEFATVMDNLAKLYIDAAEEISSIATQGNVIIRAAGVSLKNLTIKGDLIIADGVGEGDVTLDNVAVEGRTLVRGGGENSFIIKGASRLGRVIACKVDGRVRITVEDPAKVEVIYVDDGSDDVFVEGIIGTLEVAGDGITAIATKGIIGNAIISGDNSTIILKSSVILKGGRISGNFSRIVVEKGATANNIIIDGVGSKVEDEGIIPPPSSGGGGSSSAAVSAVNIATDIDISGGAENDATVKVTLTTATGGAEIFYTTDGSTPTADSTKYTTPFNVQTSNKEGETVTIKAIGIKSGSSNSTVAQKVIEFKGVSISTGFMGYSASPYLSGQTIDVTIAGATFTPDVEDPDNWVIDTGTSNYKLDNIKQINDKKIEFFFTLIEAGQGSGRGSISFQAKAAAVTSGADTNIAKATMYESVFYPASGNISDINPDSVEFISGNQFWVPIAPEEIGVTEFTFKDKDVNKKASFDGTDWNIHTILSDIGVFNNPAKISYYEGDVLDLTGLIVELTYSDDSKETVDLSDFAIKGITTDPANGSILSIADHNGKNISVFCNGLTAESGDSLKVLATTSEFAGGNGTAGNPYQVATAEQLDKVRDYLDKHFIQTADIDMEDYLAAGGEAYSAGQGWLPIGSFVSGGAGSPFTGSYDGNGKTISNLTINRPDKDMVGLFEYSKGTIDSVSLPAVDIVGKGYVGGIAGFQISGKISNCSVSGSVKGTGSNVGGLVGQSNDVEEIISCHSRASVEGINNVGGLIGHNESSKIDKCYAAGNVKGNGSTSGGLVATNYNGVISNSYATGSVEGTDDEVGGLVGWNTYSNAQIINSYATGQVKGGGERIGGLVGQNKSSAKVDNSYATGKVIGGTKVGGLIGETIEGATSSNSYWDTQTSGLTVSAGGNGYSTPAMIKESNSVAIYVGWDFADTWTMEEGVSYPYLKWQRDENIPLPPAAGAELLGYWNFDEGSGLQALDSSGNNYHGSIEGALWTEDRNGESGKALSFAQGQWVSLPGSNLKAETMSFSAWIYITDKDLDSAPIFSAEKGAGGTGFAYRLQVTPDFHLRFETIAPYSATNARVSTTDDPLDLNKWYHVAASYDGIKTRIYLDGVLVKEDDHAGYKAINTAADIPVGIGHLPGFGVQWFRGNIDDARIYSGVLSLGEIEVLAELRYD